MLPQDLIKPLYRMGGDAIIFRTSTVHLDPPVRPELRPVLNTTSCSPIY